MEYPAISLHQPYASLIAIGAKPFETRGRRPPLKHIGKRIAIQAAKRPCLIDMEQEVADDITEAFGFCNWNHRLPRGVVVCTAKLVGAYRCGELRGRGDIGGGGGGGGGKKRSMATVPLTVSAITGPAAGRGC